MIASTTTGMVVGERRKWPSWITRSVKRNILEKKKKKLYTYTHARCSDEREADSLERVMYERESGIFLFSAHPAESIVVVQRNFSRDLNIIYEAINFMFFFLHIKRDSNYIIAVFTHS